MALLARSRMPRRIVFTAGVALLLLLVFAVKDARAIPAFNRQTGQNCVACHAGGQFPELTPYGRYFKMTGYTIGQRTVPLSVMACWRPTRAWPTPSPTATIRRRLPATETRSSRRPACSSAAITDNLGAFAQITNDRYGAEPGLARVAPTADNIDLRYADHFVDPGRDLIFGVSVNNNPSVSDPWNTRGRLDAVRPRAQPDQQRLHRRCRPLPGLRAPAATSPA